MAISRRTKIALLAVGALGAAGIGAAVWWSTDGAGDGGPMVTAHRWERVIVLERFDGTTWKPAYEVKKTGTGTDNLAWPTDVPAADATAAVGAMRPGQRIELFYLDLGALGSCRVAADVWRKYADGNPVTSAVRGSDGKLACRAL